MNLDEVNFVVLFCQGFLRNELTYEEQLVFGTCEFTYFFSEPVAKQSIKDHMNKLDLVTINPNSSMF